MPQHRQSRSPQKPNSFDRGSLVHRSATLPEGAQAQGNPAGSAAPALHRASPRADVRTAVDETLAASGRRLRRRQHHAAPPSQDRALLSLATTPNQTALGVRQRAAASGAATASISGKVIENIQAQFS